MRNNEEKKMNGKCKETVIVIGEKETVKTEM